jgi:hypothetical protein
MDRFPQQTAADLARGLAAHLASVYGESPADACENCGTTRGFINEIWTDDGRMPLLCEDCAAEVRRLEMLADELAARPGCEERAALVDSCEGTWQLVNALRAHDMTPCTGCASAHAAADRHQVAA